MNRSHGVFADDPVLRLSLGCLGTLGLTALFLTLMGSLPNNLSKEVLNIVVTIPLISIVGGFIFSIYWARKACEPMVSKN